MTGPPRELDLASRVRINDEVLFRDLDGETAVLHLGTGVYFGLDPVASRIWTLVASATPLRQVLASLVEEYEVAEDRCHADLLRLVRTLAEHDLVTVEPPATA